MRSLFCLWIVFLLSYSCKDKSEETQVSAADIEQVLSDMNDGDNLSEVLEAEEEPEDEFYPEEIGDKPKSVFDMGENMVYIKKTELDEDELAELENIIASDERISEEKLIQDIGPEFALSLPGLKSHLSNDEQTFRIVRDILELNIAPISVSKGFEIDGRERIRDYTGDRTGGFLEDMTEFYMFRGGRTGSTTLRRLGVASDDNFIPIMLDYFQVSEGELGLLKSFPGTEQHYSSLSALNAMNFEIPNSVTEHLDSPECSEGFRKTVAFFKKRQQKEAKRFMQNAMKSKDAFYKLNPGWYGEQGETGVTYIDARRNYIYLPFGPLSFADKVISHDIGTDGANSEGVLNEPDMALETFRLADPRIGNLGINGVLTLEFSNNALTDVNGPDLYVFEMGKIEPTKLEISKDGKKWLEIGRIEGGTAMVDIADFVKPGETFNYIRLTDLDTWSTVPGADVDAVAAIGGALRLNIDSAVLFDTGEFQLKETATAELEKLLEAIREIPSGTIIVEGHTDNVGSPGSNLSLSKNRANEVNQYLKGQLEGEYKYEIQGFGESRPVAPNDSDENRQKNRRVEILVVPGNESK